MSDLDERRRRWTEDAWRRIDQRRLTDLIAGMVDIPSPTGEESELAHWLVSAMRAGGLEARYQALDDRQANAVGRLRGDGTGSDLLLFAPIDTLTVGDPAEDVPWAGPSLRADMEPRARVMGDHVMGLGASNPKGHAAALIAAAEAVSAAGVPLRGDVIVGLGAGGMPTNGRTARGLTRRNSGQGVGCSFMLEQGVWADHAVIAKPGWAVAWEEVGLCWFEVRVHGTYTYVGSRHRMPYRNAVADAAVVIDRLERWFPEYAEAHTDGLVAPQGIVAGVEGGWARTSAITPAVCRIDIDLRISPRSSPARARREFARAIARIRADHPHIDLDWDLVLSIPGTSTPAEDPVVRTAVAAWESVAGRSHEPIVGTSGATDANILRSRGLPTARIGMDRIGPDAPVPLDFPSGQNVVDVREAVRLTKAVVHIAVALCT